MIVASLEMSDEPKLIGWLKIKYPVMKASNLLSLSNTHNSLSLPKVCLPIYSSAYPGTMFVASLPLPISDDGSSLLWYVYGLCLYA